MKDRAASPLVCGQPAPLTPRQFEVLRYVVAGLPSKRIALGMGISQRTVENHRASIMTRTGTASVQALTCFALRTGMLTHTGDATHIGGTAVIASRRGPARDSISADVSAFEPGDLARALANTLTARQAEVLRFVVAGYTSKRIAFGMGISQRTVEKHRASVMVKTGTASVSALTLFALRAGILKVTGVMGRAMDTIGLPCA